MEATDHAVIGTDRKKVTGRQPRHRKVQREHKPRPVGGGMFSRVRSGIPTGTTPHFKLWMADLNLKRTLQLTPVSKLAALSTDPSVSKGYQLLVDAGIRSVHELTQRETLEVPGIGPKRRDALRADLAARNVAVRW